MGPQISFVDIQAAPWVLRLRRVLKPYRGWPDPEEGSRWASWVNAIETNEHVVATTSSDELYLDSYQRYAGEFICTFLVLLVASTNVERANFGIQRIAQIRLRSQMRSILDVVFRKSNWVWCIIRVL